MPFGLKRHLTVPVGVFVTFALIVGGAVQLKLREVFTLSRAEAASAAVLGRAAAEAELTLERFIADALAAGDSSDAAEFAQRATEWNRELETFSEVATPSVSTDAAALADAATNFVKLSADAAEKAEAVRREFAELGLFFAVAAKPAADGSQTIAVSHMFAAAHSLASAEDAKSEAGGGAPLQADADAFKAALTAYRQHISSGHEKTMAADAERQFEALAAEAGALRELRAQRRSALREITGARLRLEKTFGEFRHTGGAADPNTRAASASALAVARWLLTLLIGGTVCWGIWALALAARGIAAPAKHLAEIARAIIQGNSKRRANVKVSGEFHLLAEALNEMIDARLQAEDRLRLANESLELKVSARTAELWKANRALREESEQRARAEREFQQAQKMDALGKLAGSIAHDFNNLLTIIIGSAECARERLSANHQAASLLRTVQQAGERAAALTRPLLTFSRSQVLAVELVDLNEAAEEASRMLQRLLGVNIEMRLDLEPDLRSLKVNPNQLQQVLINLGVNARDAMEGAGVLLIKTRTALIDAETAQCHGAPAAESWVELAVSDTGCGMDAATKARIFEPFFTTKPSGKGTGLGLATVFGIVKQCHGFLDVDSTPGEGTTFRVFLPAATGGDLAAAAAAAPAPASQDTIPDAECDGTLLLVDDEEDIRELAIMTLEGRGYRVLGAGNADEAISLAKKHGTEIRALITDVLMPGMNGVELAELLVKQLPHLKVLFVSGHSNDAISPDTLLATHAGYLQKPYRGDALAGKISEVLAGKGLTDVHAPEEAMAVWMA